MQLETFFNYPIIQIILISAVALVLYRLGQYVIIHASRRLIRTHPKESKSDHKKRADTLSNIFSATFGLAVWLVAIGAMLSVLDFDLASVATGAGFLGIIVGLGAQATIRDYLAGIAILAENQYRVGDIVTLSGGSTGVGASGTVEEITLRITKLRALDGTINIIRNGEASVVINRTFQYSSVVLDIGVDYESDIDTVERVINEVGLDMLKDKKFREEINEPIRFIRVDDFGKSAIIVKVVGQVKPAKQWEVAGEYRRRLLKAFRKANISIAFP